MPIAKGNNNFYRISNESVHWRSERPEKANRRRPKRGKERRHRERQGERGKEGRREGRKNRWPKQKRPDLYFEREMSCRVVKRGARVQETKAEKASERKREEKEEISRFT